MSVIWLRTAAALYSCGLVYALIYLLWKSTRLFTPALIAFGAGAVVHLISLVELRVADGPRPAEQLLRDQFALRVSDCGAVSACVQLLPGGDFRGLPVSAGVLYDPDRGHRVPGGALEQSAGPQCVAAGAHYDGADRLRRAGAGGGCFRLLPAAGATAEVKRCDPASQPAAAAGDAGPDHHAIDERGFRVHYHWHGDRGGVGVH